MSEFQRKRKISMYVRLVCSYVAFALLFMGITFVTVIAVLGVIKDSQYLSNAADLMEDTALLESGDYDKLNVPRYVGTRGFLQILDVNGNVVYTGWGSRSAVSPNVPDSYTEKQLALISDLDSGITYMVDPVLTDTGETEYVITRYTLDDTGLYVSGVLVLDENRDLVFSDMENQDSLNHLTQQDMNLLQPEDEFGFAYIEKYGFVSAGGEPMTVVLYEDLFRDDGAGGGLPAGKIAMITAAFLVGVALLLLFFAIFIMKQIKHPLAVLKRSMAALSEGREMENVYYEGPKEFVEIMDSFDEMSERLRASEEERLKMEQSRQKMLADISHDLKTPITVIQGYARAVDEGVADPAEQKRYLETIQAKADFMSDLINSFYEYSRLEHPEFQMKLERRDMAEYLRQYIAERYDELHMAGFEPEVDIPEKEIFANVDVLQFRRIFDNIIANTMKHNSSGCRIFLKLEEPGSRRSGAGAGKAGAVADRIHIFIGDDGSGIPPELRDRIFEPFVVGNDARTSGTGSGLGMSIAKKIVEAHGGKISLTSDDEWKTVYEITLRSV